tara:strand:- start:1134 stop:1235 length:102 start_codon:yes stop_codon:yes gene_type:complete
MTPIFGFGMLAMGFIAIIVATIIAYFIININEK